MTNASTKQRGGVAEKVHDGEDPQRDGKGAAHGEKSKKQVDRELDEQLKDSFPSSDPPTYPQPTGSEPAGDPKTKP